MKRILIICGLVFATSCGQIPEFDRGTLDRIYDNDLPPTSEDGNDNNDPRITFLNVGQGDATLIKVPNGDSILIDAGPPGAGRNVIIPYMESNDIDRLTHIVTTHYHADHIGGIPEVIAGTDGTPDTDDDLNPTGFVYDRGEDGSALEQPYYPLYAASTDEFHSILNPGDIIYAGELSIEVVAVAGELIDGSIIDIGDPIDENAASIAILVEYRGFSLFIGGDLTGGGIDTPDIETTLAPLIGDIDILKVSHHGSRTSTNQPFLDYTTPEVAIISYGENNDHGHPDPEIVDRLTGSGIEIHTTTDDHLEIVIDREGNYSFL